MCGVEEESIEHVLLLCPCAQYVWFASSLNYKVNPQAVTLFDNWYNEIYTLAGNNKELRSEYLTKVAFLCWEIWKARCSFLYSSAPFDPGKVALKAESAAAEFLHINHIHDHHHSPISSSTRLHNPLPALPSLSWINPPVGCIKITLMPHFSKVLSRWVLVLLPAIPGQSWFLG